MVSDYYIGLYRQPRQFCEASAEVTNYVIAFGETCGNLGPPKLNVDVSPKVNMYIRLGMFSVPSDMHVYSILKQFSLEACA